MRSRNEPHVYAPRPAPCKADSRHWTVRRWPSEQTVTRDSTVPAGGRTVTAHAYMDRRPDRFVATATMT